MDCKHLSIPVEDIPLRQVVDGRWVADRRGGTAGGRGLSDRRKCRAKIIRRSVPDGLPPVHVQSLRHDVVFYYPMSLTVKLSLV